MKKKAFYLLTVKGNQPELNEQLKDFFEHAKEKCPALLYPHETIDKNHGRIEERKILALATHNTSLKIPGIKQVALLTRKREVLKTKNITEESVFLITNLDFTQADAETLMQLKRSYWDIENKLHYRKDFTFGEDRSTIRVKFGPQNMSTLRNFAIGLMLANGITNVKRCVDNLHHHTYELVKLAA